MSTIKEIARKAGVSFSTVSRALKGSQSISVGTRERVLKVAQELNYLPNQAARMLVSRAHARTHQHGTIAIVYESAIPLNDAYFSKVIRSIVEEASGDGFSTSMTALGADYDSVLKLSGSFRAMGTAGVIVVGNATTAVLRLLGENCRNCVVVDKPAGPVTSVYNDNARGAYRVVSHLIATGCRRIALISGAPDHYFSRSLLRGYRAALRRHGIELDASLVAEGEFHIQSGYDAMLRLLDRGVPPDAVFSNDEMAFGAMRAVKERGLRIPEDVSVFGFDNLPLSRQTEPPLSTVRVDYEHMARTAVRQIIENSRRAEITPVRIVLPVQLLVRGSTRPLPFPAPETTHACKEDPP